SQFKKTSISRTKTFCRWAWSTKQARSRSWRRESRAQREGINRQTTRIQRDSGPITAASDQEAATRHSALATRLLRPHDGVAGGSGTGRRLGPRCSPNSHAVERPIYEANGHSEEDRCQQVCQPASIGHG